MDIDRWCFHVSKWWRTLTDTHFISKTVLHPHAFSRCNDGCWTSAESRAFAAAGRLRSTSCLVRLGIWDKHGVSNPQDADPCFVHSVLLFFISTNTHRHTLWGNGEWKVWMMSPSSPNVLSYLSVVWQRKRNRQRINNAQLMNRNRRSTVLTIAGT